MTGNGWPELNAQRATPYQGWSSDPPWWGISLRIVLGFGRRLGKQSLPWSLVAGQTITTSCPCIPARLVDTRTWKFSVRTGDLDPSLQSQFPIGTCPAMSSRIYGYNQTTLRTDRRYNLDFNFSVVRSDLKLCFLWLGQIWIFVLKEFALNRWNINIFFTGLEEFTFFNFRQNPTFHLIESLMNLRFY